MSRLGLIDAMAGVKDELLGLTSCSSVSDSSCDANTPRSNCSRGSFGQTKRSSQAGWTEKEDSTLADVVKKFNGRNWKKIAESILGRSDVQCLHRWQKVLNPELVKGPWTKEEDDRIKELVEKHGCKKWSLIAKHLAGRIGKQCRERWHNHLDPAIKKDAWTDAEESTLAHYHRIYRNKWAEIARFLPGRTDNAIKNHWNSSKRRLDLNMPPTFPTRAASPELNLAKKRGRDISLVEQNTSEKELYKQSAALEGDLNTCSTNLSLGNPKSGITNDDRLGFTRYAKVHKIEPSTSLDETPKRLRVASVSDLKLATSPDNSFLSLSTLTTQKHIMSGTPPYRSLCYQPPQVKNLNLLLENCGSPTTPPDLALSISVNNSSPESILRNSTLSYKNTPSIIRKRTPKKSVEPCTPGEAQTGHHCSENIKTLESENAKRGSESWLHRPQPFLGRRLDYMFDAEKDLTLVRCCTPGSVTPSSKAKVMLTP